MLSFVLFMGGVWWALSLLSRRSTQTEERLERIGRPKSLSEIELNASGTKVERFAGLKGAATTLGGALEPQSDLEKSNIRIKLANAGFRSEGAVRIYHGLRMISLFAFLGLGLFFFYFKYGLTYKLLQFVLISGGVGFYLPSIILWQMRRSRQQQIFLTLP